MLGVFCIQLCKKGSKTSSPFYHFLKKSLLLNHLPYYKNEPKMVKILFGWFFRKSDFSKLLFNCETVCNKRWSIIDRSLVGKGGCWVSEELYKRYIRSSFFILTQFLYFSDVDLATILMFHIPCSVD